MAHYTGLTRVKEASSSSGTGNITTTGAASGFLPLASLMPVNGDTSEVVIVGPSGQWEHTFVTRVSSTEFSRAATPISSSTGSLVSFSAGGLTIIAVRDSRTLAPDNVGAVDLPAVSAVPSAPPADTVAFYGRKRAGRMYLDVMGPSGRDYPVMPHLGVNGVKGWIPETSTTIRVWGMPVTSVGTVSTPTLASTNLLTSTHRWRLASAATANSAAENRCAQNVVWRGNAAGLGGFTFFARVGFATLSTNCRGLFGLASVTTAISTTQVPSALQNFIGFTWDATETTLRFQHAAAATPTRIDLGSNFPTNNTAAFYTMYIQCHPNGSSIFYRIVREDTGNVAEGEVTTNIPASTQFLTPHLYMNNGGDAAAVAFDCARMLIETDY